MDGGVVIIADPKEKGYWFAQGVYNYIINKKGRDFEIDLDSIVKTKFRDKEYKIKIEKNLRRRRCFYIHDPNIIPTEWVCDLLFTLNAAAFSSPSEINVVFPYLRFARQDRKDESRVSVNIKAVADIVNLYAHRSMSVDLHSPQIQGYFDISFDDLQSHPVVIEHLKKNHQELLENLVLVSPDAGGGKRIDAFQRRLVKEDIEAEIAICYKKRSKENHVEDVYVVGNVRGKNCLILDDIVDTGGTLIKTAESLRKSKAKSISAYCTHGLFSGKKDFSVFDSLMVSNSLKTNKGKNMEIVSLTELFGEAIYRTITGESLSSLFE